jgi:hypothetical protein
MLQHYEVVSIPSADSPQGARDLLQSFAYTPVPVIAVRNTDPTSVKAAIGQIADDLPDSMSTEAYTRPYEFGEAGELEHVGLHVDHMPPVEGDEELPITYHLTHSGLAIGSLLGAGTNFVERVARTRVDTGSELERYFDTGVVDTELSDTVCHQITLEPGTLLIFKNGLPLWHRMKDILGTGRRSTAFDSVMKIHPGMGVKFHVGEIPAPEQNWDDPLPLN